MKDDKHSCAKCGRRLDGSTGEAEHEGETVCLDCLPTAAEPETLLRKFIAEIENEEYCNQAGYLVNFIPWLKMKEVLGLNATEVTQA